MQSGILQDPEKLEKIRFQEASWQQELGRLNYIGQTRFGGFFVIHVLQLYSLVDRLPLGGWQRGFFAEFFNFLFDNTSRCYLVFASFFPTLKLYFISLIIDEYGLEQCYRLFALIYSYSALSLSQSKSNRAIIFIGGLNKLFCFLTNPSFQWEFVFSNSRQKNLWSQSYTRSCQ